ncbi:hypothetical protein [Helicobacter sp. L8]|uniref:hypothetical protein n=1 Tax=Helicobacter sp. L8 TaxID=2316078 RepID=UPI000EB1636B|nr:hypothetical protein [Helicobacter sp. L8]
MLLYEKIQELLGAIEKAKAENMALVEFARNSLTKHIDTQMRAKTQELKSMVENILQEKAQSLEIQGAFQAALNSKIEAKLESMQKPLEVQITGAFLKKSAQIEREVKQALAASLEGSVQGLEASYQQQAQAILEQAKQDLSAQLQQTQRTLLTQLASDTQLATDLFIKAQERALEKQIQERLSFFAKELEESKGEVLQDHAIAIAQSLREASGVLIGELEKQLTPQVLEGLNLRTQELSQHAQESLDHALKEQQEGFKSSVQGFIRELEGHYSAILEQDFREAIEGAIRAMDISFLKQEHDAFFTKTRQDMQGLFKNAFNKEVLAQVRAIVLDILQEEAQMRALKEMELEAQLHLTSLIESNAVRMLQEQASALEEFEREQARYFYQAALAKTKQKLVEEGFLPAQELKHTKAYKVN